MNHPLTQLDLFETIETSGYFPVLPSAPKQVPFLLSCDYNKRNNPAEGNPLQPIISPCIFCGKNSPFVFLCSSCQLEFAGAF